MASSLEKVYPNVALWVKAYGWIEIGQDHYSRSFIRALDEGGMVWEGSRSYKTLDEAFEALEQGIAEWTKPHGE